MPCSDSIKELKPHDLVLQITIYHLSIGSDFSLNDRIIHSNTKSSICYNLFIDTIKVMINIFVRNKYNLPGYKEKDFGTKDTEKVVQ